MMKFVCLCCGMEGEFETSDEAFQKGWDTPPNFSYVSCDLCPGVCAIGLDTHRIAHDDWRLNGRPEKFSILRCAGDSTLSKPGKVEETEEAMRTLQEIFKNG